MILCSVIQVSLWQSYLDHLVYVYGIYIFALSNLWKNNNDTEKNAVLERYEPPY